ncbi:Pkinase-domain-containing protein [Basidiobolus meristosporus CBS 931.73]|uniref:Pkinase-domain-containing protein n=1 Tax=Basidiobolus meristosporus CBS 931.73 TaxID=1314790 RepID=A0A1Y1Y375_9FUNG|nr:Pkinase-domain-containing protein [Basidiobolus meristosporus CBS 931.73]|eukprot:ORX92471.1 Pkinase-domain-containing protein [Basidiobolus meristosporus CBS 931.73]
MLEPILSPALLKTSDFPVSISPSFVSFNQPALREKVSHWTESQVAEWLHDNNLGQYKQIFSENDINGEALLDLSHETLKELHINTVGERVRILTAIRGLKKLWTNGTSEAEADKSNTYNHGMRDGLILIGDTAPEKYQKEDLPEERAPGVGPPRKNEAKTVQFAPEGKRSETDTYASSISPSVYSNKTFASTDVMSVDAVKQHCVRVFGDDGQTRVVNLQDVHEASGIMAKILHKFNIVDDTEKYTIFTVFSDTGAARIVTDQELMAICKSPDRPERERLILRKIHQPLRHDDFKRQGTLKHTIRKLENFFGERPPTNNTHTKLRKIFGERPPSELISMNLGKFFPEHESHMLEVYDGKVRYSKAKLRQSGIPTQLSNEVEETLAKEETKSTTSIDEAPVVESAVPPIDEKPASPFSSKGYPDKWIRGALIGTGSFGNVYLGLNPFSGELMAVKQVELPKNDGGNEERKITMLEALQHEISLLKDLKHPNIVRYLGSQMDEEHLNIFLEYVPGGSVAALLEKFGNAFEETLVRSFVRQILMGLNYLHGRGIIHRDIKGGNILVDNKGCVKISDFGISKKTEASDINAPVPNARASLQGSVFWMSPEVVKNTHYTKKADIWSLGCLVIEMFTGEHPFPASSQMQAIFQIGRNIAPDVPENISDEAKDFLKKTFEIELSLRPTAEELLNHPFVRNANTAC